MKIEKIHNITFNTDETIITAALSGTDEWVMLMSSGIVIRYRIGEPQGEYLFKTNDVFEYEDGGFDLSAPVTLYIYGKAVALVNNYKCHAFVHYSGKHSRVHLQRKDYHAEISDYPIAIFNDTSGVPHLAYGVAWNHLQILNLDTLQVLTAAKSLIEDQAEERSIAFNNSYGQQPNMPWPREYDYFFGKLMVSPNGKNILSNGWVWGSSDSYNVYDISDFISNPRIKHKNLGCWEHSDRAACWINNNTVAVAYSPYEENDEGSTASTPLEIHFYTISGNSTVKLGPIIIPILNDVKADMYYNNILHALIITSPALGILALSLNGSVLLQESVYPGQYHAESGRFIKAEGKNISVYQITG